MQTDSRALSKSRVAFRIARGNGGFAISAKTFTKSKVSGGEIGKILAAIPRWVRARERASAAVSKFVKVASPPSLARSVAPAKLVSSNFV